MPSSRFSFGSLLLVIAIVLVVMPGKVAAFGAGNIPSIAQVEGHNWRHGDIEDMLKTIAFLHGKKWTTLMVQRTYFGNWLRDYSQAIDVGSLKGANAATIRVLVWVLSFLANGYATEEFEVTEERLGVYRPEEHIDNPLGYADGDDARTFDKRLRGPVSPIETEIDTRTGMKNYISNEHGSWATSAGYLRFSIGRSIHFGRLYCHGSHGKGKEEDLCEALRCLGQSLHCMEDFSAHSNYCELALRELGYHEVFPHCGSGSEIHLRGKRVFPLVTGTFGGVDFLHSVLGEANDHFTQSEVDQLDIALKNSEQGAGGAGPSSGSRGFGGGIGSGAGDFISLVSQLPGIGGGMASEARGLKRMAEDQDRRNEQQDSYYATRASSGANQNIVPGMSENFDPVKVSKQIYPILEFRDKIVKSINRGIAKIPGLENLLEHISETLTAFVLGLLAPFVRPIINAVTKALKDGSSGVINASAHSQLEPWKNPQCTDPTHSMLSKDHFTNILNPCAGRIATTILKYVVPRILYAWDNPGVPVDEVVNDVLRAFHHPALRDEHVEIQREMFDTVRKWADEYPRRHEINHVLGSDSVRNGKNHILSGQKGHSHGGGIFDGGLKEQLGHGRPSTSLWSQCATRDLSAMGAGEGLRPTSDYGSNRPTSSNSYNSQGHSAPSPSYGYSAHQAPPQGGGGYGHSSSQYQSYGQQGYQQQGYGAPPQGEASSYYTSSQPPPQNYQSQGYGGPPPHQQGGYPPYGNQQWGGGYGNAPYP
ncbi:heterokaryon incompatibility Het-C [Annulohypoxylon maeteangense]|uniref:heterokaryon incompatibility Het-C n=1 Tax=Annulohypoxylon maeteangense TaxID=1927788 RepID=UPI0020083FC8|nr:heterokaryon incompatibility Het-C [Annulohypoxylon maeteangense]KAI0885037.1 heterokaryon incompatibility Het-C [Annulohypoxylon maeteangense]